MLNVPRRTEYSIAALPLAMAGERVRRLRHLAAILAVVGCVPPAGAHAQQPSGESVLEVVSVRPALLTRHPWVRVPDAPPQMRMTPGRFTAFMATVRYLIQYAYKVRPLQVVGGPRWIGEDRFDIEATVSAGIPLAVANARLPEALGEVLRDRFKLQIHTEQRRLPVYALVTAHRDGRLERGLRPSTVDCAAVNRKRFLATQGGADMAAKASLPNFGSPCGSRVGPGTLTIDGTTLQNLANTLMTHGGLDRFVVDRTNLAGNFDIELQWAPSDVAFGVNQSGRTPALQAPSLFTAIEEQLGLKLEPREELVDVIVIDQVERLAPN
jgi:uncharacterized protein (TIGR03435 family)